MLVANFPLASRRCMFSKRQNATLSAKLGVSMCFSPKKVKTFPKHAGRIGPAILVAHEFHPGALAPRGEPRVQHMHHGLYAECLVPDHLGQGAVIALIPPGDLEIERHDHIARITDQQNDGCLSADAPWDKMLAT